MSYHEILELLEDLDLIKEAIDNDDLDDAVKIIDDMIEELEVKVLTINN